MWNCVNVRDRTVPFSFKCTVQKQALGCFYVNSRNFNNHANLVTCVFPGE